MSSVAVHRSGLTRTRRDVGRSVHPRRTRPGPLRLTRRGRVVALLLILIVVLLLLTLLGPHSAASGESGVPVQTSTVQVGPGDTLWDVAAAVAAPGKVRETVQQIEELNAMSGPGVRVGQQIAVPVG
jgi:LysM repeat protein